MHRTYYFLLTIIIALAFSTLSFAQSTAPSTATSPINGTSSYFNPNQNFGSGDTSFGGNIFSGVGGTLAGCSKIGDTVSKGVKTLFSKLPSIGGNSGSSTSISAPGNVNVTPTSPNTSIGSISCPAGGCPLDPDSVAKLSQSITTKTPTIGSSLGLDSGLSGGYGMNVPVVDQTVDARLKAQIAEIQKINNREQCLNGVAYAATKFALSKITDKTLNWVNTGMNGNPLFVRDVDSYLRSIKNQEVSKFLKNVPNDDPIYGNMLRSVLTEQITGRSDGLINKTMDTPQAREYEEFQKDFTRGGWEALVSNNPLDAIFSTSDQLASGVTSKQTNAQNEIQRNGGFLDLKRCVEWENNARARDRGFAEPNCLRWEVVTPGQVISAQVATISTSPIRQLENADAVNELLGAFFDEFLNNLFQKGLSNMKNGRTSNLSNFGGYGSNIVMGSNGQPISGGSSVSNSLGYQSISSRGLITNDFDISRPQNLDLVIKIQKDFLNRASDSFVALNHIVPALGELDYCLPGPNPTWEIGLSDNFETLAGSLQVPPENTTVLQSIVSSIPVIGGLFSSNNPHALLATQVQMYDKVSDETHRIRDIVYKIDGHSIGYIFNNVKERYAELVVEYRNRYKQDTILNAYSAVDVDAGFAKATIREAYAETGNIIGYSQATNELNQDYSEVVQESTDAVKELEAIRKEVNAIVSGAKTRYIAEQQAKGMPVNLQCINQAYVINNNPIVGVKRQESDNMDPKLQQSIDAKNYFYSNL